MGNGKGQHACRHVPRQKNSYGLIRFWAWSREEGQTEGHIMARCHVRTSPIPCSSPQLDSGLVVMASYRGGRICMRSRWRVRPAVMLHKPRFKRLAGWHEGMGLTFPSLPTLLIRDLWMWGMTPPPAMVACRGGTGGSERQGVGQRVDRRTLIRVSSSSSPRMASCKWRGVIRLTCAS